MSRKAFYICMAVLAAIIIGLIWWAFSEAEKDTWVISYEMTNRNIEWTGAGYGG